MSRPTSPKRTSPRRANLRKAFKHAMAEREKRKEFKGLVSKHAHGPATEITRQPKKKHKRQHFDTYLRPDGMPVKLTKGAIVCALIYDYPQLSDNQIARLAGVNKRTLYKFPFFVQARRMQMDTGEKRSQDFAHLGEHWDGEFVIKE